MLHVRNTVICIIYGLATISRLLKIIGVFCERDLQKRRFSAKETYDFKEPTSRSHPIPIYIPHFDASLAKEPYKTDDILQKSPIKQTIFCKRAISRLIQIIGRFCIKDL